MALHTHAIMRSPSILRALAGHYGICLHSASYVRSQHAISDAFTCDVFTLTALARPTARTASAAHARSCASAVYHAHAEAVCNSRPIDEYALSVAHTQSKRKHICGLTGVACMAAKNAKCIAIIFRIGQHHVRWNPTLRCPEPNSRSPYDKQEFVRRESRSPLRQQGILHRSHSIRHATAH